MPTYNTAVLFLVWSLTRAVELEAQPEPKEFWTAGAGAKIF